MINCAGMIKKTGTALLLMVLAGMLSGCDPLTRHKTLSVIFDGVPSLPPPEQLCAEYAEKRVMAAREEFAGNKTKEKTSAEASSHEPYTEKLCNDCHDKSKQDGLVRPKNEVCFVCHSDFVKGPRVHGPVAVGDCLACHEPHEAAFPSLLKAGKNQICSKCHREKRLASDMHDKLGAKGLLCTDCHDPHYGKAEFFLK